MKQSHKFALAVIASVGLGVAAAAYAQPGSGGGGMGHDAQGGTQQGGMMGGMGAGGMGGMGGGMTAHGAQQLMTPEERTALMEKMRNARTPEEHQKIAAATRAEMQKRAKEKGITLPEHHGPRSGATPQAPATN